jgi:hypothetical protein
MSDRKAPQRIHKLMVREVKEKKANYGELRRLKKKAIVRKGIPNIPSLAIYSDFGITYVSIIQWGREIRLHYFNKKGEYLYCELSSPDTKVDEIYNEIKQRSKYISRYPPKQKTLSVVELTNRMDQKFRRIWENFSIYFHIPKKYSRNRPLIKLVADPISSGLSGICNTNYDENFIFLSKKTENLSFIYSFYAIFFLLPKTVRSNTDLATSICMKILDSLGKVKLDSSCEIRTQSMISDYDISILKKAIEFLPIITDYYEQPWESSLFSHFLDWIALDKSSLTKRNQPLLWEHLFNKTKIPIFLHLSCLLGIRYDCSIPKHYLNPSEVIDLIILNLLSLKLVEALALLSAVKIPIASGITKLISKVSEKQFSQVLTIIPRGADAIDPIFIHNRSDCYVSITHMSLVSENNSVKESAITYGKSGKKILPVKLGKLEKLPVDISKELIIPESTITFNFVCFDDKTEKKELYRGSSTIAIPS